VALATIDDAAEDAGAAAAVRVVAGAGALVSGRSVILVEPLAAWAARVAGIPGPEAGAEEMPGDDGVGFTGVGSSGFAGEEEASVRWTKRDRILSAISSSIALECVFFSVTPT
jgi:hypothetical protein